MKFVRLFGLLVAILMFVSCANTQYVELTANGIGGSGIGGTGKSEASFSGGGIGGTGKNLLSPGGGGIGGTGKNVLVGTRSGLGGTGRTEEGLGGTGIVGTITGFGSIWVNDAHIHFNNSTPIRIDNREARSGDLRLGQVVAVLSDRQESDYQARTIDVVHELIGPLRVEHGEGGFSYSVLKQALILDDAARFYDEARLQIVEKEHLADLLTHSDFIAKVSGYRTHSGSVRATRIDLMPAAQYEQLPFQLMGQITLSNQQVYVADLSLDVSPWLVPDDLSHRYMIQGIISEEGELQVNDIGVDSSLRVIDQANEFLVQGLVDLGDLEDSFMLAGMEFELSGEFELEEEALDEEFVQMVGEFDGERALVDDFSYFSEQLEAYIDLVEHYEIEHEFEEPEFELEEHELDVDEFEDHDFEDPDFDVHELDEMDEHDLHELEFEWEEYEYEFEEEFEFEDEF